MKTSVGTGDLMLCNSEKKKKSKALAQKCKKITNKTSKQTSKRRKTKQKMKLPRRWKKNKHKNFTARQDGRREQMT